MTEAPASGDAESIRPFEQLTARLDAMSDLIDSLEEQLHEERAARERLEKRVEELSEEAAAERDDLRDEVAELDARTDLLDLAQQTDRMDPQQRQLALIQHLYQKVQRRNDDEPDAATIDKDDAENALHYCHDDRTLYYKDMEQAAVMIDGDVLQYDLGELRLDLEAGDLPPRFTKTTDGDQL